MDNDNFDYNFSFIIQDDNPRFQRVTLEVFSIINSQNI